MTYPRTHGPTPREPSPCLPRGHLRPALRLRPAHQPRRFAGRVRRLLGRPRGPHPLSLAADAGSVRRLQRPAPPHQRHLPRPRPTLVTRRLLDRLRLKPRQGARAALRASPQRRRAAPAHVTEARRGDASLVAGRHAHRLQRSRGHPRDRRSGRPIRRERQAAAREDHHARAPQSRWRRPARSAAHASLRCRQRPGRPPAGHGRRLGRRRADLVPRQPAAGLHVQPRARPRPQPAERHLGRAEHGRPPKKSHAASRSGGITGLLARRQPDRLPRPRARLDLRREHRAAARAGGWRPAAVAVREHRRGNRQRGSVRRARSVRSRAATLQP